MSEFTKFTPAEPVVVPAKEEVVYDQYWLETFIVRAPSASKDASLSARFKLFSSTTREFSPNDETVNITINQLFSTAASKPKLAMAMEMVFQALKDELNEELGVIPDSSSSSSSEV